jgi:hypothetical protein
MAARGSSKYSSTGKYKLAHILVPDNTVPYSRDLTTKANMCITAALSKSTWAKYCSAWNAFKKFEKSVLKNFEWPLQEEAYTGFATWCIMERNLSSSTTKAYLTALTTAQNIAGHGNIASKPGELTRLILAGGRNLEYTAGRSPNTRRSMNLTVLKIISHRLASSNWDKSTQQVIWTAVTTAFFSSARMGELLSSEEQMFDPTTTLQWDQVLFRKDGGILLHIRVPKIPSKEGDFLDLFPFEDKSCCPVLALKKLFLMQHESGMLKLNLPVFRLPSGKNLTPKTLNVVLKALLGDIFKKRHGQHHLPQHEISHPNCPA